MGGDRLAEAEADHLQAVMFEQRRLSHMLRQRGAEIEALHRERDSMVAKEAKAREQQSQLRERLDQISARLEVVAAEHASVKAKLDEAAADRERLARNLEQSVAERTQLETEIAQITAEREQRDGELARAVADGERLDRELATASTARDGLADEVERVRTELTDAQAKLAATQTELGETQSEIRQRTEAATELSRRLEGREAELQQARYEARRADRRVDKLQQVAAEARGQDRRRIASLTSEAAAATKARDEALKGATTTIQHLEQRAHELGGSRRDIELLTAEVRERETLLADSDRALAAVAEHLRRVRASRSWRWGHRLARSLSFRRRSDRSALDVALGRLEAHPSAGAAKRDRRPS